MVSKCGFIPNGRRPNRLDRTGKFFKQDVPLNGTMNGLNIMFNASQIPDNPGYMDFNNPTPPISNPSPNNNNNNSNSNNSNYNNKKTSSSTGRPSAPVPPQRNHLPPRNLGDQRHNWIGARHGRVLPIRPHDSKFGIGNRQFNGITGRPRRGIPPPVGPMPMRGPMPQQLPPPSLPMEQRTHQFNGPPGPIMPNNMGSIRPGRPMPPIRPPMLRRNRNMPPPVRRPNGLPPAAAVAAGRLVKPRRNGKPMKINNLQSESHPSKKTLKEIINQYPLDKPWVTDEIRQEHAKKVEIEERLKGNKDDELFAKFKIQRDKFVNLYESAKAKFSDDTTKG